jgi:hypothetical protein
MDRISHLINIAGTTRRKIWGSLPFSLRVADFFSRLAVTTTAAFGKTIYSEFLAKGIVKDMPDIYGKPASEFDTSRKPIANYLPSGYGLAFGKKVFGTLMSKWKFTADITEQLMLDYLVGFLDKGSEGLEADWDREHAENYVLWKLNKNFQNHYRVKKEVSDIYFSQGKEKKREIPVFDEETAERELKRALPKLQSRLEMVHPDAALYLKLAIIDGHTDREIIGDVAHGVPSLLPTPYSLLGRPLNEKSWSVSFKPKILEILKKDFGEELLAVV